MNRLTELLAKKDRKLLNIFFTAGHPSKQDTLPLLKTLEDEQVDLVELGIPFSDPLADGPTIQESSKIALSQGVDLDWIFQQVKAYRDQKSASSMPILLMGYLNTILRYGFSEFCEACEKNGIDGLIIPDLPLEVYQEECMELFEKHGLSMIFLITPKTSEKRIWQIDQLSSGFIYAVSSASTTGSDKGFGEASAYLERLEGMGLKSPVLVGFNISSKADVDRAHEWVNGAIIGSAFIKAISQQDNPVEAAKRFIRSLR